MLPDTQRRFLNHLKRIAPTVERAFREALLGIKSVIQSEVITEAIRRGDVEGVVRAVNLGPEFFDSLDRSVDDAYRAGAAYQATTLPATPADGAGPLVFRFNGRHPRAEAWARENSARMVREISTSIERAVRQFVVDSLERELGARFITRSLLGTKTGEGVIGLTRSQAGYVTNMIDELSSPSTMGDYFDRTLRDRRFDSTVRRAMKTDTPLSQSQIRTITGRYEERLLARRARTIGIQETSKAMNAGRHESVTQLIESGRVPEEAIDHIWDATPGPRTRDSHALMEGQRQKWGVPFTSPISGDRLMHPHDTSLGAGPGETMLCRCTERIEIDWKRLAG